MENIKKSKLFLGLGLLVAIIFLIYAIFFTNLNPKKIVDPTLVQFDTFTTNLQGGEFNYLKMDLSLKMANKNQKEIIQNNKSHARRSIIDIASRQDGRTLLSQKGKENFKGKIEQKIENDFGVRIENIYFTDFVLAN